MSFVVVYFCVVLVWDVEGLGLGFFVNVGF